MFSPDFGDSDLLSKLTEKELRVYRLLCRYDESYYGTSKFSRVFIGIVRTLNDRNNLVRFFQVSNSIRWIADEIMKNSRDTKNAILDGSEINALKKEYCDLTLSKINDARIKTDVKKAVDSGFVGLIDLFRYGTRNDRLLKLFGPKMDFNALPELLQNRANELTNVYKYFNKCVHDVDVDESEFIDKWLHFQDFLIQVLSEFFEMVKELDPFLEEGNKINQEFDRLKTLISKPECFKYFFRNLDNVSPMLFDLLNKNIDLISIPEPDQDDEGYSVFPSWYPGIYLSKVSDRIPDKVFLVLKNVRTSNLIALGYCSQAILNMPDSFLVENNKEIVQLFNEWLNVPTPSKYIGYIDSVVDNTFKLFGKYVDLSFYQGALKLLDILSETIKIKPNSVKFRFKNYGYINLAENYVSKLIENNPKEVIDIIEKHLRNAINLEQGNKNDMSSIWRPSVEHSYQIMDYLDPENTFVNIVRDAGEFCGKKDSAEIKLFLDRWINDNLSIFQRLAMHFARVCDGLSDFAKTIILDRTRLFGFHPHKHDYHEFLLLLRDRFCELSDKQKMLFLSWVEEGIPDNDGDHSEQFKQSEKTEQLRILIHIEDTLRKDTETKEDFRYYYDFMNELKNSVPDIENPSFISYITIGFGAKSSLSKQEIGEMTSEQFINWTKANLRPPYKWRDPKPRDVAGIFESVVKDNPAKYVQSLDRFIDEEIFPVYLYCFIRGLEQALKEGKTFELEPVIKFIENPLKFHSEPEFRSEDEKDEKFDIGQYSSLRSAISDFIGTLIEKEKEYLTEDIMDRTQNILIELIEKDEDLTEQQDEPDANNMDDYVTLCINSNRGRAMQALMRHSLRRSEMESAKEEKSSESDVTFPPGQRMNLYKQFFTERLDKESSPSVQSSYGSFLTPLFYLDQNWIIQMIKQEKLFPKSEKKFKFWDAHWQGYIGYNRFYTQIYELLKDDYIKAVNLLDESENDKGKMKVNDHLPEHLMIACWMGLEDVVENGIIDIFFKKASSKMRDRAIWFVSQIIEVNHPAKNSDEWQRIKKLWEFRAKSAGSEELAIFIRWLKYCPEDLDDIVSLIEKIIVWKYQDRELLEYLNEKVEINPLSALYLLNDYIKKARYPGERIEIIKQILEKAIKHKNSPDVVKYRNQAVDRLGKMGFYDFLKLHIEE